MPTSILMPSLSPTMEEGVLAKWLVKEGDLVKPGTLLCSVETDKTTVDYESMDEGYVRKIILPAGTNAKVNQLIAVLADDKDEDISAFLAKETEKSAKVAGGESAPAQAGAAAPAPSANVASAPAPAAPAATPAPAASPAPVAAPAAPVEAGSGKSSPLARKLAAEAGIPVGSIAATGPGGRVIARDVEAAKANPPAAAPAAKTASGKSEVIQTPHFGSLAPVAPTRDVPLTNMRKIIGKRLLESAQTTPVFFVTQKIEVDALNRVRAELNRAAGYKISVNDLIVKASAFALRQYPAVNSSFHGDFIRENANIDICVAVAIPDGLITPIVKNADQKGLGAISQEVKALVGKAKAGKLSPEEFQGGTFTISNLGMFGVDEFTAIINPPQAAILAVGGTSSEVYLDKDGTPKERQVMKVTISADHRVVDGAMAAQFLSGLKSLLENPVWLML
ncbi:MAG TPA: pyruvate dehydrogenase complex dihydrolipoamide acetyltransferase [Fibrobacteria bacterium]|nr:pyruvate dehydrogenase complex dihydrolipoamide acetyltransferase [Fibrobacteria bacterium]